MDSFCVRRSTVLSAQSLNQPIEFVQRAKLNAELAHLLHLAQTLDAFFDPLLGRWSDALYQRGASTLLKRAAVACALLGAGFYGLFFPMVSDPQLLLVWAAGTLLVTYLAYSFLSISHQSWGAMLHQWWNIDTYNHLLLMPPIIAWLVMLKSGELGQITPRAFWPGLLLVIAAPAAGTTCAARYGTTIDYG